MAKNINSLLNKRGWTGEEVGKALIASLLHDIKYQGKADYQPLFSQADFDKMESSLQTDRDFLAYSVYREIYSSLVDSFNKGQGLYQQFYNGYYRYLMYLRGAMAADEALAAMEKYPLIMTEEQYKRAEAETLSEMRGHKLSYYALIFTTLSSCLEALEEGKDDRVPAKIRKAIEATEDEPAENQRILSSYNEDLGRGYYTLPDGRRSDNLSIEEWQTALQELYLDTHKLTINGEPATPQETLRHFNSERLLAGYELFFRGEDAIREAYKEKTGKELEGDATELLEDLESIINGAGASIPKTFRDELYSLYTDETPTEWHYYETPPEGLTKFDIISQLLDRYSGGYEGDIPEKDQLKEFKRDYPALYDALDAYLRERVPTAREIKPAQIHKELISCGELIDSGIIGYEDFALTDFDIIHHLQSEGACKFADAQRATARGIAILKKPRAYQLDDNGNYQEDIDPLSRLESLDALAEEEYKAEELEQLRNNLFAPSLRYIYAFNALIRIIGAVYDIDEIEVAELDTKRFESQIRAFNNLLYSFYFNIYGDEEEKARKRGLIKDLFQPVDYESLKPSAEALEALKTELSKAGISTTARTLLGNIDSLVLKLESGEGAY